MFKKILRKSKTKKEEHVKITGEVLKVESFQSVVVFKVKIEDGVMEIMDCQHLLIQFLFGHFR